MPLKAYTSGHSLSLTSLKRLDSVLFLLLVTLPRDAPLFRGLGAYIVLFAPC